MNTNAAYWSDPYGATIAGTADITLTAYDTTGGGASTQTVTITFNKPVDNPVLHVDRIGGANGGTPNTVNTSVWTLSGSTSTGGSVTLSKRSGNNAFSVTSTRFQRVITGAPNFGGSGECTSTTTDDGNTACGSVQVTGTGITQLVFTVTFSGSAGTGDALEMKVGIPDTKVIYQKQSVGGTTSFTFAGTNGVSGSTLNTATTNPAASATYTLTSNTAATTITETAVTGYAITDTSCVDQNSVAISSTLAGQVLTIPAASITSVSGQTITCTFTNTRPVVRVQKTTLGGAGGPFSFAQTNLASTPAAITTTASGTATPASPGAINVTTVGANVTLTETLASGYALTAASCTDANSAVTGNTGAIGTLAGNVLTIPGSNVKVGADFTCTFTNSKLPTLTLSKTSLGGVGGYTFTGTNGWTSQIITTTTAGTAVSGATQTLAAASTATTITEAIPAGYALTAASCTGLGTGGTATPNLTSGTMTLDTAATAAGSAITCSFTNTKLPTLTLSKTSLGGVGGFTFTGTNGWTSQTITTVTSGTAVSGATQILAAASTSTTITEAIPAGYALTAASCTGLGTGGTATPNLTAGTMTLDTAATAAGSAITCSFTNTKLPTLTLSKTSLGGVGGFTFTGTNGWTSQTITTVTSGTAVSGATQILAAASTATTITEAIPAGYALTAASCTGLGTGGTATPNLTAGTMTLNAAATAAGSAIACSFTNTKLPTLTLSKTSLGGIGGFTFTGTNGWTSQTITTTTAGTAVSGATQTLTAASTATTITEAIPAGYALTAASCSGLGTGGTATPNLTAGTMTLDTAATAAGSAISCAFTNSKLPTLTLSKTSLGGVGGYTFTGTNGWTSQTITTTTAGTAVSGATQTLAAASTATTITEAIPAGYAMTAASCSGLGTGGTATPNLTAGTMTLDTAATAAGSAISCAFTNSKLPTLTLSKTSLGGIGGFTFTGTNGWTSQTITTTTAGTAVSGATQTLTAASTATTITETITPAFLMTGATCTGLGGGTATVNTTAGTIALNAAATAAGATIACTVTNTAASPAMTVTKTASPTSVSAAGTAITYTIVVKNTGNVTLTSITASDALGTVTCATSGTATIASLASGSTETCTMTYTATQAQFDGTAATIDNTATAATTYNSAAVTASGSAHVTISRNPQLTIVKSADKTGPLNVGDVVTYTYRVTNAGNVTMTNVTVNDTHNGSGAFSGPGNETAVSITNGSTDAAVNGSWDSLKPGDVIKFTATYTVTQQDVDTLQ